MMQCIHAPNCKCADLNKLREAAAQQRGQQAERERVLALVRAYLDGHLGDGDLLDAIQRGDTAKESERPYMDRIGNEPHIEGRGEVD